VNGKIRNDKQVPRTERNCPICGKPAVSEHLPFCSRRCANIDLNRWLSGAYAIAGPPASDSNDKADD
jgi:endogenous inhibitor of DNA gyrase (YacG/DUF329 family)